MPSTSAAAATRARLCVSLRSTPFAVLACGPPAGRAKKSRVARRARAQEVLLDVETWPCRACDARSELACLEPAARIGLLLACSLALSSVLLPALFISSPSSSQCPSDWPPAEGSFPDRALRHLGVSNSGAVEEENGNWKALDVSGPGGEFVQGAPRKKNFRRPSSLHRS